MTETKAIYETAQKCPVCGTPAVYHSSREGTVFVVPLDVDDRDRSRLADELVAERAEVVRLRGELDALVIERDRLRTDAQISLTYYRQMAKERDSACKWASRWERVAHRFRSNTSSRIVIKKQEGK